MAWYGVNFVLGAGLHSYGFSAGGVEYVSAFVAATLLFVTYAATVRQSRLAESGAAKGGGVFYLLASIFSSDGGSDSK